VAAADGQFIWRFVTYSIVGYLFSGLWPTDCASARGRLREGKDRGGSGFISFLGCIWLGVERQGRERLPQAT
jgi:hypothetical protein